MEDKMKRHKFDRKTAQALFDINSRSYHRLQCVVRYIVRLGTPEEDDMHFYTSLYPDDESEMLFESTILQRFPDMTSALLEITKIDYTTVDLMIASRQWDA